MNIVHDKEIEVVRFFDERYYTTDKETFYPAISTITDVFPKGYGFNQWLKQVGMNVDEIVRKAGEQAKKMYSSIQSFLDGQTISWANEYTGEPNYQVDEWQMLMRFMEFWDSYEPEIITKKHKLISEKLGFAETIDLVCEISGQVWLIDFKISNSIYDTDYIRLSAMQNLWNEQSAKKVQRAGILHLKAETKGNDKRGKNIQGEGWQLKEAPKSLDEYWTLFQHTFEIWKWNNPNPKPKNFEFPDQISIKNTDLKTALKDADIF